MNELHDTKFVSIPEYNEVLEIIANSNYYIFLNVVLKFKSDFDKQNEPFPVFLQSHVSSFYSSFEEAVRDICRKERVISITQIDAYIDYFNFYSMNLKCQSFEVFHNVVYQMYFYILEMIAKDVHYHGLMLKTE